MTILDLYLDFKIKRQEVLTITNWGQNTLITFNERFLCLMDHNPFEVAKYKTTAESLKLHETHIALIEPDYAVILSKVYEIYLAAELFVIAKRQGLNEAVLHKLSRDSG